ncbi:hypothetical protein FRC09_005175, partial [Ceratobasidium sp. 395]
DMSAEERQARDKFLNTKFRREEMMKLRDSFRMRVFRPPQYRNSAGNMNLRGKIIRKVMEQKMAREGAVASAVEDMLADADASVRLPTVRTT